MTGLNLEKHFSLTISGLIQQISYMIKLQKDNTSTSQYDAGGLFFAEGKKLNRIKVNIHKFLGLNICPIGAHPFDI